MAFELEALVGHMYVAGGRTIKTTPPGALCEVAPKRAARGREVDTLFVLVLPSGNVAPNTFYEQMSLMAAERYFSNGGSVTSALRDVYNTLNNNLFEHNDSGHKHYEANMITAVMRGTDLYVARTGASTLILRHNGETKTVPDPITDDDKLFKPPLGVRPIPEVEMTRFTLDSGTRMILADASIAEITEEKLTQALVASNIEEVLDDFKLLVTLQIQLMVIEFVPPEKPVMVPAATGQSSAVIAAEIAAARAKSATEATLSPTTETPKRERPKRETPQERLKKRTKGGVITVTRSAGHALTRMGELTRKILGGATTEKQRRRNMTFIAVAVFAIPIVLISAVMLSWVGNVGETAYEDCVGRTNDAANVARTLPPDSRDGLIIAWQTTLTIIEECKLLRPEFTDIELDLVEAEAQLGVDLLTGITRRDANVLWSVPDEGANIREIILNGLDIYAFDNLNNIVYRIQLAEDGQSVISVPQPLQFMSIGAPIDGMTLGSIVGIAYDDDLDRIATLDENGVLVRCRPLSINDCDAQQLQGFELISNPVRIDFWQGNFYVLDTAGEQIWRYDAIDSTNSYNTTPREYYQTSSPANMDQAVDFAIGDPNSAVRGRVFTLFNDGTMTNYLSGEPASFIFRGFPPGLEAIDLTQTQAMFLNDSDLFAGFYVISRPLRTIYYTTTAGTFQAAYRVTDETIFERLNDVTADPEENIVYAASGNALFYFDAEINFGQ